jgi:WD40-like Beta Propeller Repeat
VDTDTLEERVLAEGRQVGWGQPHADVVPIYGPHWDPGQHRDLELLDVRSGVVRTALAAAAVRDAYRDWVAKRFGDRPISIFFPIFSPDLTRIIFKVATPAGGDFRSKNASERDGLVCYDLQARRFLWMHERWGHPAWHADSRSLVNYDGKGLYVIDAETGAVRRPAKLPAFPGSHPSFGPGGSLFATDFVPAGSGAAGLWAVAVGSLEQGEHVVLHRFDNARGSTSWRRSHPHPAFSADGRRLYFNVSADRWTRLFVAECESPPSDGK